MSQDAQHMYHDEKVFKLDLSECSALAVPLDSGESAGELRTDAVEAVSVSSATYVSNSDDDPWFQQFQLVSTKWDAAESEIRELKAALRWIPVGETLPDEKADTFRYLVHRNIRHLRGERFDSYVDIAGYGLRRNDNAPTPEGWRWEIHFYELDMLVPCNCWIDDVTHWMPLPNPPEKND